MPYNTVAEIRSTRVHDLKDDEKSLAIAEAAITIADAEVDSRLGQRYAVPFDPVPAIVKACAADLAAEGILLTLPGARPEGVEKRAQGFRERADRILKGIAEGHYRGIDFLEGRDTIPGVDPLATPNTAPASIGVWSSGAAPALRDFDLYTDPSRGRA